MSKKVSEIRQEFEQSVCGERDDLYQRYGSDPRAGVQKLIETFRKKDMALVRERERLEVMRWYEHQYEDYGYICGIDEAGRGPLAGPVVAGAVILPKGCEILYLNDSKKLSAAKREMLYDEIMEKAIAVGVGMSSPERIDEINILQATYEAMRKAIQNLGRTPQILLNDAVTIPDIEIPQMPIIKGDAKSVSIAAASIIAKVTRDRLMTQYEEVLPGYGFASNKGYGSRDHIDALKRLGPTPIHRRSFIHAFVREEEPAAETKAGKSTRETGTDYEKAAGYFLEQKGYEILKYNYRCSAGEIDLIARDADNIVFCEVKYRSEETAGTSLEAVDERKQHTIFRCAKQYLAENGLSDAFCRFDVLGIDGTKVSHVEGAFTG